MRNVLKIFFFLVLGFLFVFLIFQNNAVHFFDSARLFLSSISEASSLNSRITELTLENESLKKKLEITKRDLSDSRFHYKIAQVYSRYPSNDRSTIIINIGAEDGVLPGMPVMIREGILFGKVHSVSRTQSNVETIFSPRWKSSVGIGERRIKAALRGANVPVAGLISKEDVVEKGDSVVNLSPEFPLYASLGSILSVSSPSNDVWRNAEVNVIYDFREIDSVQVITNFP